MTADASCVVCGRPTDGWACGGETAKAAEQLRQILDLTEVRA